jgi:hypothetical protein
MNKILIPIDLSKSSINQLDTFIQNAQEECVECLSMFSNFLTNSTTELLFNIETKSLYIKMPSNFKTKFEELKVKYAIECKINLVPFVSFTTNAFNNFIEWNSFFNYNVPKNLESKMSVNPNKFITKSK